MGKIVRYDFAAARAKGECLAPGEIGFLRSLIRATADLADRERDDIYNEIAAFMGLGSLTELDRRDLPRVTLRLHAMHRRLLKIPQEGPR